MLFFHSTCDFCLLDSDSLFMECVAVAGTGEHRAMQVFPLADRSAAVCQEQNKC